MGPQLFLLALLLLKCTEQAEGNGQMHDTPSKLSKHDGSGVMNPVSTNAGTIRKPFGKLCSCEGNRRWEVKCPCAKSALRKTNHAKWRKQCQNSKHMGDCYFFKKTQRKHGPIVPF